MAAAKGQPYVCGWCAGGRCDKCFGGEKCACQRTEHQPGTELKRVMLASQCPDLAPAITRGVFDAEATEFYGARV